MYNITTVSQKITVVYSYRTYSIMNFLFMSTGNNFFFMKKKVKINYQ